MYQNDSNGVATTAVTGLCVNCSRASTCFMARSVPGPITLCEEYELERVAAQAQPAASVADAVVASSLRGLCVNCEQRSTCSLPKAEAGVWHCEEYA